MTRRQITNPQATAGVRPSGLVLPTGVSQGQAQFNSSVKQILESGLGARGVPLDRNVTRRELDERLIQLGIDVPGMRAMTALQGIPADGVGVAVQTNTGRAIVSFDAFARSITSTRLFSYLQKPIDDPNRFDELPEEIRQLLVAPLTELAQQRGADVRTLEGKIQEVNRSLAYQITEVTAGIQGSVAGVRQAYFASASATRAVAGSVTTITARLDNFNDGTAGTATIEVKAQAMVTRSVGLEAQYTIKLTAGGAAAGLGLAVTAPVGVTPSSAFIIQADKFAIVDSSYAGGLTNSPPSTAIMFGVDADGAYVGGNLKVQGKALILGNYTLGSQAGALHVNQTFASVNGVVSYSDGASNRYAYIGIGTNSGSGLYGQSNGAGGFGVIGVTVTGGVGVRAVASVSGTALEVLGPMTIDNTTLVTNLNADGVDGYHAGNSSGQVAVSNGTLCTNLNSQYLNGLTHASYCQIVVTDTGTATVSGTGLNMTCAIAGYQFAGSSNVITLQVISDRRLKRDIEHESLGLDFLRALTPRTYRMKNNPEMMFHGFIHDEVDLVLPREGDSLNQRRPDGYNGVDYMSLIAPIVKGIQQQDVEVQALRERVRSLEIRLALI